GPDFDLYLVPPGSIDDPSRSAVVSDRDDVLPGAVDRASAFALLRQDLTPGCMRKNLVTRALASAGGWRIDAAEDPAVRESTAAYLAQMVAPCGAVTDVLIDDFQSHPERAIASAGAAGPATSVALPWYLDVTLGGGRSVPTALAVIAAQRTDA